MERRRRRLPADSLPVIADLVLLRKGLKKGFILWIERSLEDSLRVAEKATGERFMDLAFRKDSGPEPVYYLSKKGAWWDQCLLEACAQGSKAKRDSDYHRLLGKFLGYPMSCCVETYVRRPRPLDRFLAQPGSSAFYITRGKNNGYSYIQRGVVSWIPCSPRCEEVWRYIGRARRILSKYEIFKELPFPDRRAAFDGQ